MLAVFLAALSLRVVVAVVLTLVTDGVIAPDEAIFRHMAATVAAGGSLEAGDYGPTLRVTRLRISSMGSCS